MFIKSRENKSISLTNPRPEDFFIEDIAVGLSNECRFGGQVDSFYSVAQHSVLVYTMCPPELKLAGLLHDASEAYIKDIQTPLKAMLPEYRKIEENFMKSIFQRFYLEYELLGHIKPFDKAALQIEINFLREKKGPYFEVWTPEKAKSEFLKAYYSYYDLAFSDYPFEG